MALQDIITNLGTAIINLVTSKITKHDSEIEETLLELKAKIDALVENDDNSTNEGVSDITTQEILSYTDIGTNENVSVNCIVSRGYKDGKSYCDYVFETPILLPPAAMIDDSGTRLRGYMFTPDVTSNKQIFYSTSDSNTYVKSEQSGYMAESTIIPAPVNQITNASFGISMSAGYLWEVYTEATTEVYTKINLNISIMDRVQPRT